MVPTRLEGMETIFFFLFFHFFFPSRPDLRGWKHGLIANE